MLHSERHILHLDLDTFFVSVERLINPRLIGKPVIVGGMSDRAVVAGCSYETRKFGVHSGMPVRTARLLCNEAIIIKGDHDLYSKYSHIVTDIITERAPLFEKTSIDEHYIDLTGMDRFFGCMKWSHELRAAIIHHTRLPISFGLSLNKTVSKIATGEAKPNGEKEVPKAMVKSFLSPLSIRKIPGIGKKTYRLLGMMGIRTIKDIMDIPPETMERVFGKNGSVIWKRANGIDNTPVKAYTQRKSISTERTFEQDTTDVAQLQNILVSMVEKLAFQLRCKQKLTACVAVKIRYSNFDTCTRQKRITYTSLDHDLIKVTKQLFEKLYKRRMMIRLIGVKFSDLVNGFQQLDLFDDKPEMINLYITMDKLKNQYGTKIIRRSTAIPARGE